MTQESYEKEIWDDIYIRLMAYYLDIEVKQQENNFFILQNYARRLLKSSRWITASQSMDQ